jgi:class 3 adenylate cyclase/tetratricopeptide (TPR) repeat protein
MKCPKCQFENQKGAKFCNECGHNLTLLSKATSIGLSFDEKLDRLQRYLPKALTEKILSQRDKIEGERRQATIMFCDMMGSTPLTEKLGAEETFSLMDQVYEILIHKVNEYEGTVNELRGDGILALFGAPLALEDAPQRALRSALAIHREMERFNKKISGDGKIPPILLRIGINSGPLVVGAVGNDLRVQFTAVGDTINMAARMEELAEPGTTYLAKKTYKLTSGLFRFEALGEMEIKGKDKPLPVYKLISAKEATYRPRLGPERMIYSEMVGRDSQLARLELQVMKAINGQGSIVNIIGEAGIGKSRLVAELKKREAMKGVTLFEGRAISIGRNLSFHPIIDLLKQWARIREVDGEAMALGKLETAVRGLYPKEIGEVLPFVATLMGMKLSGRYAQRVKGIEGEALEKLILKNVREILAKATEVMPLVIVTEDLHWADTSSIELMESLFRLAGTHRILFVNVFRPGHKETGDRIVETLKEKLPVYHVEIVLEPLDEKMSEALITNMLNISALHHTVIGQIVSRTGGNPFFIEEVVRSFIDERAIVKKNGTFQVTDKIASIAIPNTINDVLMARIDRLDEDTRNLVKVASVIGRSFFYRILSEVASPIEDIDGRLSYLKEKQLILERSRMGEVEYLFKHALAQEAAYESILLQKRRELHLRVARTIEKIFDHRLHEFYGMLAYHYSKAENLDKAETYLIKAGTEALKSSASNEALHYYQEGLGLYLNKRGNAADPEKVATLEKNIALALYNRGQYEEAIEYFDKALNHYWGKLPKHAGSAIFKFLSAFLYFIIALYLPYLKFRKTPTRRDTEIVDLFYKKCKALAMTNPKRFFIESFYFYRRLTIYYLAKFENGIGIFVSASSLFSFTGISFRISRKVLDSAKGRNYKTNVKISIIYDLMETIHNYFVGNWKAIKAYDDDLVDKNLNLGEVYEASQHLYWHGFPSIYQGSLDTAESIVNKLIDIFEVFGNEISISHKYELNINFLMECRKLHDALIEVTNGIEFVQKAGSGFVLLEIYSCQALIHLLMGDLEQSENALKNAKKIRSEVNTLVPMQISSFYRSQVEYDLYRLKESIKSGDKSESFEYRKKAIKSAKMLLKVSQKTAQHRTEAFRLIGLYYWLINNQKKATKWWHKAIKEGERLGARLQLSRVYFEVSKRLLEADSKYNALNGIKAEAYLEKANVLFKEMDMQWDLDELGRLVRG